MLNTMTAKDARDNFTDLLGSVYYGKKAVAVEKKGRIFAMVINPEEYLSLKKTAKGKFFELVEKIQKANKGVNPAKVLRDVSQAVEEVRREQYGKD